MSLFPAFINARLRKADSAPPTETTADSDQADSRASDPKAGDPDDNIFDLLPPKRWRRPRRTRNRTNPSRNNRARRAATSIRST